MKKSLLTQYDRVQHKDGLEIWYKKCSDEVVCMVSISDENGQIWIHGLFVSPLFRHIGICIALLDYATFNGGEYLKVSRNNITAFRIYKQYGFEVFDEDEKYLYMSINKNHERCCNEVR